jgi:coenzyme F420-reducing hydrogenase delta subunit/ferredoxin
MFEPRIVAFLCSWCSYTGADTAGIARLKSPANIHAIRVPCSGRVSPELIMRTFDQGADGVLVLGCHIGECHYETGNHRAAKRVPVLQTLLSFAGLEPERLRLDWVSASEGERFARITTEFTEKVRALGPVHWRVDNDDWRTRAAGVGISLDGEDIQYPEKDFSRKTEAIRAKARELLAGGQVNTVIGYELNRRGRTRPAFIHSAEQAERLVWNADCTNNLSGYVVDKVGVNRQTKPGDGDKPSRVAVVVKPCDSRAINVLLAENQVRREQVFVLGVACEGVRDAHGNVQSRCVTCQEAAPAVFDALIEESATSFIPRLSSCCDEAIAELDKAAPSERMEFWLSQFDRCIRCYACRQACPMCNCPTCLYERDDTTYVGLGIRLNEKRTFHLGRAFHLAGRCVGCNECERACPMDIPLSLINQKLAAEIEKTFGQRAGTAAVPSPIVTILSGEYKED